MPAKNIYHDAVLDALKADGWTITDDPLTLKVGERDLHIDIGAERLALADQQPDRPLFLAVPTEVYNGILSEPLGQIVLTGLNIRVLVFEPNRREVVRWIS